MKHCLHRSREIGILCTIVPYQRRLDMATTNVWVKRLLVPGSLEQKFWWENTTQCLSCGYLRSQVVRNEIQVRTLQDTSQHCVLVRRRRSQVTPCGIYRAYYIRRPESSSLSSLWGVFKIISPLVHSSLYLQLCSLCSSCCWVFSHCCNLYFVPLQLDKLHL